MNEIAVFTEEVAAALIEKGYALKGRSSKAWFFDNCANIAADIERALNRVSKNADF